MGSQEKYLRLVIRQNDNNNPKFQDWHILNYHGLKKTFAIMSTQVTYEINHISLLQNSTISNALNFCFLCILLLI